MSANRNGFTTSRLIVVPKKRDCGVCCCEKASCKARGLAQLLSGRRIRLDTEEAITVLDGEKQTRRALNGAWTCPYIVAVIKLMSAESRGLSRR